MRIIFLILLIGGMASSFLEPPNKRVIASNYSAKSADTITQEDDNKIMYMYPSIEDQVNEERRIHIEKLSQEMVEAKKKSKSIRPVLRGKLKGYENYILNTCHNGDIVKAKINIALIGIESGYGTSSMAQTHNNFHGIKWNGKWVRFSSIEDGLCGSKKYIGKYIREFSENPTEANMKQVFKPYCADADGIPCGHTKGTLFNIYQTI